MSAIITPSLRPMHYVGSRTIDWTVSEEVREVAFSVNDLPPAISTYIAYDTLSPPGPFLATTQDGRGNVVFDGGFPKYYNDKLPSPLPTSFSQLPAGHKYLYNAFNFIANPEKVSQGVRKILVIGNTSGSQSYTVKGTRASDFRQSLELLGELTGFEITIKDHLDYGGVINPTLTELDQYCGLILFGTLHAGDTRGMISDNAIQEILTFRNLGNGLIFITDHGPVVPSLEQAATLPGGFFDWLNRITIHLGAYFSGDYNRTPVNVGFLRSTYGDHPLYNGLSDSESIFAGGSESVVVVTETTTYPPSSVPSVTLDTLGKHTINLLVVMKDGTLRTIGYSYTIIEGEFLFLKDPAGDVKSDYTLTTFRDFADFTIENIDDSTGTLVGEIYKNDLKMGEFTHGVDGTNYRWFSSDDHSFPVEDGDVIGVQILQPHEYYAETVVVKTEAVLDTSLNLAYTLPQLPQGDLATLSPREALNYLGEYARRHYYPTESRNVPKYATDVQNIFRVLNGEADLPEVERYIYRTSAELQAALSSIPTAALVVIDAQTGDVYIRQSGEWVIAEGLSAVDFLGAPRVITNPDTLESFQLLPDGTYEIN